VRIVAALLAPLLFAQCASRPPQPSVRHVVFYHPNGQKAAEGDFTDTNANAYLLAKVEQHELPPWKEYLRSGEWHYWYPDGAARATVTYAVSEYQECCVAGLCSGKYERIVGKPLVFDIHRSPIKLARAPRYACIRTNCAGCEQVFRPRYVLPADLAPEWNPHDPSKP
jgi:hypothetical protein